MNLFIDTNIFLNFYHFTNDDLEELEKLIVLISNNKIQLIIPEQVIDEFKRNREVKLKDAIKQFESNIKSYKFPQFYKSFSEFQEIKDMQRDINKKFSLLKEKVNKNVEAERLKADDLIGTLFSLGVDAPRSQKLIEKGILRYNLGNPPGKDKSYGDAINWESLLEYVEEKEDLYFLSDDKDFFSIINENHFNPFLLSEWRDKKSSEIFPYRSLTSFFTENFPEVKLASELEKEIRIQELAESGSFFSSRKAMWKVSELSDYSTELVDVFIDTCVNNTQVLWIADDEDMNKLIHEFIESHRSKMSDEKYQFINEMIPKLSVSYVLS